MTRTAEPLTTKVSSSVQPAEFGANPLFAAMSGSEPDCGLYAAVMNDVMEALRAQDQELLSMVTGLPEDQLALPSACEGWSVSDVLLHLAQTNEMAAASASGQSAGAAGRSVDSDSRVVTDVEDNVAGAVERERGASGNAILARWAKSADDMVDALEACDPAARVKWVAGDMAPRTLATTRLAETWIHTGDVCVGLGIEQPRSDRIWHIARLVHRTLPYSFRRAGCESTGEVRFELRSPTDEQAVWSFGEDNAETVITGPAIDLCHVAGQRANAKETSLRGAGPDAATVLRIMRTFA
jgi:uncharacterized protein (TIGR03084 family)